MMDNNSTTPLIICLKILIASLEKIGWRKFQTFINKKNKSYESNA